MQIDSSFFAGNRQALLKKLPGGLIVLTAHCELQKSRDVAYPFEQENNFWYVSGIEEPNWYIIIDGKAKKTYLVEPALHEARTLWNGALTSEQALHVSAADTIIRRDEAASILKKALRQHRVVYTLLPQTELKQHFDFLLNPAPQLLIKQLKTTFKDVRDCQREFASLRSVKQQIEIDCMKRAISISVEGMKCAFEKVSSYHYEYEFEAELSKFFLLKGGQGHAYKPMVANGRNACTLHYDTNNAKLNKRSWLLVDAGARYGRYCADITRTVPLGPPTKRQLTVYNAVKKVHDIAVALLVPGQPVDDYYDQVEQAMGEELHKLKLVDSPNAKDVRLFFPHAVSHGLGIDVHDPFGRINTFEAGMVMTVEPGIYIPQEDLGIRLENDIHITAAGPVNLSAELPNDVQELQRLVRA